MLIGGNSNKIKNINFKIKDKIEEIAGFKVERNYDISKPKGVRGRSSDNSLINSKINWSPKFSLKDGLEKTYSWIYSFEDF